MQADVLVRPARLPWWDQFHLILRMQFAEYRDSAAFMALNSFLMPVAVLWFFGDFVAGRGPESTWFLAGNAVMTVAFGSANFSLWRIGQLRLNKELTFYASLPISKPVFVGTVFCLSQIATLPGLLCSMVAGHLLLGIPLTSIMAAIPLLLLAAVALTVVASAAGAAAASYGRLNLYGNLITFMVIFLSPSMVPFERLALPFRVTSYLLPTGQASLALTEAFAGRFGPRFWLLCALLAAWTVVAGAYGFRRMDWRND